MHKEEEDQSTVINQSWSEDALVDGGTLSAQRRYQVISILFDDEAIWPLTEVRRPRISMVLRQATGRQTTKATIFPTPMFHSVFRFTI
jgi:hypothetical protein